MECVMQLCDVTNIMCMTEDCDEFYMLGYVCQVISKIHLNAFK